MQVFNTFCSLFIIQTAVALLISSELGKKEKLEFNSQTDFLQVSLEYSYFTGTRYLPNLTSLNSILLLFI